MSNHGTAYPCTNTQFATVSSRITVALPQALQLSGIDVKSVIKFTNEGERLSLALAEAFKMLYNDSAATIPQAKQKIKKSSKPVSIMIEVPGGSHTVTLSR